jgi:hypothetical protein
MVAITTRCDLVGTVSDFTASAVVSASDLID